MIAVITIEGVLAQGPDLRTARSYKTAASLWRSLRTEFQLVALTRAPAEVATWWLRQEGMFDRNWAGIHAYDRGSIFSWEVWRFHEVRGFLAEGWEIAVVLDSDSNFIEMVKGLYVPTMWVSYPAKQPGFFEESDAPRPWAEVAAPSSVFPNQEVRDGTG